VSFLVDTNVLGELTRPRPNRGVVNWAAQVKRISLSVVSLEEIHFGLSWKPNARIEAWFQRFFAEQCEILPVTGEIARRSGFLRGRLQARGRRRTQADMLIAATASTHALTLVTRNEPDFEDCDVTVLNPFS
jgi:predicted nucleic acid-binding protein